MSDLILPPKIFNTEKSEFKSPNLFLGQDPDIFDTINKNHPDVWKLYKEMKSLDWDENEFNFHSCNADFKTCDKSTYDIMVKTLTWQWEADSVASRSIAAIMAPFITSDELWACWQRISDNEVVHAATYSEIVRGSFDDPKVIRDEVMRVKAAKQRLTTVANELEHIRVKALQYALGLAPNDQETYNAAFMFPVIMLALERMQFMSSFAVTFGICETGLFQPIGKAVQKICQDELEVHCELDKAVIRTELKTERGQRAFEMLKPRIKNVLDEVLRSEMEWNGYLFSEGRELLGQTRERLDSWSLFNANDVYTFLDIPETQFGLVRKNPLKYMERWCDISKTQASPQEQDNGQYRVGVMRRDDEDVVFDIDL